MGIRNRAPLSNWRDQSAQGLNTNRDSNNGLSLRQAEQLFRAPRDIGEMVRKWNITFSGDGKSSIDKFIADIERHRRFVTINEQDLLNALPVLLTGTANHWYEAFYTEWATWAQFCERAREHFGAGLEFQQRLESDILARTQGEGEPMRDYIFKLMHLMGKRQPPMEMSNKLDTLYKNMRYEYKAYIKRKDFGTVDEFIRIAVDAEKAEQAQALYRPPPLPEHSLLPEMAFHAPKSTTKHPKQTTPISAIDSNQIRDIAAIIQEAVLVQREMRTNKDTIGTPPYYDPRDSDSSSERGSSSKRRSMRRNRSNGSNRGDKGKENLSKNPHPPQNSNAGKNNRESNANQSSNSQGNRGGVKAPNTNKITEGKEGKQRIPKEDYECPNCNTKGHYRRECPKPLDLKCYSCKKPGYTSQNCPDCTLNPKRST